MTVQPDLARPASPGLRLAIDYGPLLVFFAVTFFAPGEPMRLLVADLTRSLADRTRVEALLLARVYVATAAFIIATLAAIVASRVRLGTVSPMLWVSGALVVVFGGLTIWFADPRFIKMKPTIVYAIFAAILFFGLATGRPVLEQALGSAYPGLSSIGWRKITRNWAIFFLVMAAANETVWRWTAATMNEGDALRAWTLYTFPGCVVLTLAFAFANVPMLLRHGLMVEAGAAAGELPPE